jgi:hypothetical protein
MAAQKLAPRVGLEPTTNGLTGRRQETVSYAAKPLVRNERKGTVIHCSKVNGHPPSTHTSAGPPASCSEHDTDLRQVRFAFRAFSTDQDSRRPAPTPPSNGRPTLGSWR